MVRTCDTNVKTFISHTVDIPVCCPVSQNPRPGSKVTVCYFPAGVVVPVEMLAAWVDEYRGGHKGRAIRNMEEMIQDLATRCASEVGVKVRLTADLRISPPYGGDEQSMRVTVRV